MEEILKFKYILIPSIVWFVLQLYKVIDNYYRTKKWDWLRIFGNGGMPSTHSAVVATLTTMIGKSEGITSPIFGVTAIYAFIIMSDAAGVRRNVGRQARVLNNILNDTNKTSSEKLQEMTGHTPIQVLVGAAIGIIVGMIF